MADQPARDGDQPPQGGDMALPPRTPCPSTSPRQGRGGELVQPGGHGGGEQRPCIHAVLTWGIQTGGPAGRRRSCVAEQVLHHGAVTVPVFRGHGLAGAVRSRFVRWTSGRRRRAAALARGSEGALVRVQGPAAPGPGVGGDLARVQRHPADQRPVVRGPPFRADSATRPGQCPSERVVPVLLGDAGERRHSGAIRLAPIAKAMRSSCAARASAPAKYPATRAAPAARPARRGQACQGAAQQPRRGRPRVIGAIAQVRGRTSRTRPARHAAQTGWP